MLQLTRAGCLRTIALRLTVPTVGIFLSIVSARGEEASQKSGTGIEVKEEAREADAAKPGEEGWISLFDGKSLGQWKIVTEYDFRRHGKVHVEDGRILLEDGFPATGIKWTGKFPQVDYGICLEAMRVEGDDFFCGLTFPFGDKWLTLVCGGWGGQVTGLSNVDGESAIDNETCSFHEYKNKQWYRIRLQVESHRIQAWLDDEQIVDLDPTDRQISIRWEVEPTQPLGISTWYTSAALRNIRFRPLSKKPAASPQEKAPRSE